MNLELERLEITDRFFYQVALTLFLPTLSMGRNYKEATIPPPPYINPYQNRYQITYIYILNMHSIPLNVVEKYQV